MQITATDSFFPSITSYFRCEGEAESKVLSLTWAPCEHLVALKGGTAVS